MVIVCLNVQTQCWAWLKLATDNFSTVLTRNLRNPRDHAPLNDVSSLRDFFDNARALAMKDACESRVLKLHRLNRP